MGTRQAVFSHPYYLKPMQLRRLDEIAARFDRPEKRSAFFKRVAAILKLQRNSRPTDRDLELVITAALQALAGHGETRLYSLRGVGLPIS